MWGGKQSRIVLVGCWLISFSFFGGQNCLASDGRMLQLNVCEILRPKTARLHTV